MALYRVLQNLKMKNGIIRKGDFVTGASYSPEALAKLEEVGAIGLLHAPPLNELPDFDGADQLATIGIVNADQLLEVDCDVITKQLGIPASTLRAWQAEVSDWLIVPVRAGGG